MVFISIKNDTSCLLWDDCWHGQPQKMSFTELYSFVKKPSIPLASTKVVFPASSLFNLPLSVEVFDQFSIWRAPYKIFSF
jgi:hypothetical protein